MSLHTSYINAVEQRLKWLKWAKLKGQESWQRDPSLAKYQDEFDMLRRRGSIQSYPYRITDTYIDLLQEGDTYYMNDIFAGLVDQARRETPDDLSWDARWVLSKSGWLWLDRPFEVPETTEAEQQLLPGWSQTPCPHTAVELVDGSFKGISEKGPWAYIKADVEELQASHVKVWFDHDCEWEAFGRHIDERVDVMFKNEPHLRNTYNKVFAGSPTPHQTLVLVPDPPFVRPKVFLNAVGWREIPFGAKVLGQSGAVEIASSGCYQFCFYWDKRLWINEAEDGAVPNFREINDADPPVGFWPWSYFMLRDGHRLGERMLEFEEKGRMARPEGQYVPTPVRTSDPLHEMRWLYAAFHLMAQRLALTVRRDPKSAYSRQQRRKLERDQVHLPMVNVVTLRRLEEARQRDRATADVDWQWQWSVKGHWRNQFYPSEGIHKPVFIESFMKGPADKPVKPGTLKLYVARR